MPACLAEKSIFKTKHPEPFFFVLFFVSFFCCGCCGFFFCSSSAFLSLCVDAKLCHWSLWFGVVLWFSSFFFRFCFIVFLVLKCGLVDRRLLLGGFSVFFCVVVNNACFFVRGVHFIPVA